jgi:hypothetical protein
MHAPWYRQSDSPGSLMTTHANLLLFSEAMLEYVEIA